MKFSHEKRMPMLSLWPWLAALACSIGSAIAQDGDPRLPFADNAAAACGYIVNANVQNQAATIFDAALVYQCLTSVPFDPDVATRFIRYYNDSLQFQSTLAFLANPPQSYQQPRVDLLAELAVIQANIDAGHFPNQYEWEASLQRLVRAAHDGHLILNMGILAPFQFGNLAYMVSASVDGIKEPQIFLLNDVIDRQSTPNLSISPITRINGLDVVEYLTYYAVQQSFDFLEPHADWNQLMSNPSLDIQGYFSAIEGDAILYPGQGMNITFENGTSLPESRFISYYISPGDPGPLATPGDFYNFFVLGLYPASVYDPSAENSHHFAYGSSRLVGKRSQAARKEGRWASSRSLPGIDPTHGWNHSAYPQSPNVSQPGLGDYQNSILTGYFLNDNSTAVLSVPSFQVYDDAGDTFRTTVSEFIDKAKQNGLTKIIIDVQRNFGGSTFLAIDTFKRFFPTVEPNTGSRMRISDIADVLGTNTTNFWKNLATDKRDYYAYATEEWVITDRLNAATGANFTSWEEYFDRVPINGDHFSAVQQYNLSSYIFDVESLPGLGDESVYGYDNNVPTSPKQPFETSNIIILSDGICADACALFMQMMRDAGVRTVAAGGRPRAGPMQAPSGTRGAANYDITLLDEYIKLAAHNNPHASLPDRRDQSIFITDAFLNLRDQVSPNTTNPLQFAYVPANCRIYYTLDTVYNFTALWMYASSAMFVDSKLCVPGSTGHSISYEKAPSDDVTGRLLRNNPPIVSHQAPGTLPYIVPSHSEDDVCGIYGHRPCTSRDVAAGSIGRPCGKSPKEINSTLCGDSSSPLICVADFPVCGDKGEFIKRPACALRCYSDGSSTGACEPGQFCQQKKDGCSVSSQRGNGCQFYEGYCATSQVGSKSLGCFVKPKKGVPLK